MAFLISLLFPIFAQAQYTNSSISFSVQPATDRGCVKVSYFNPSYDFPTVPTGEVESIRFYFSANGADDVTQKSLFQESTPMKDESDQWVLSPDEFCGFKPGRYDFKYGLVDMQGQVIEFQSESDSYSQSVEIDPVP